MGQYGNQPDFGTRAKMIVPTGDLFNSDPGENLGSAALYIGTGGTLTVTVIGGSEGAPREGVTTFRNIPDGTFFPVIVSNVWANVDNGDPTTCADIVALY